MTLLIVGIFTFALGFLAGVKTHENIEFKVGKLEVLGNEIDDLEVKVNEDNIKTS